MGKINENTNQISKASHASDADIFKNISLWQSQKEHREDALAPRADEGRDKLRKATVRSKYPMTRRYPNGETHMRKPHVPLTEYIG